MKKPKKLTKKEQQQLRLIEAEHSQTEYAFEQIEETLDSEVNFMLNGVIPKPLRRELLPTARKISKAISKVYDAVREAQQECEEFEHRLSDLDVD
jgi:hypothetical protein